MCGSSQCAVTPISGWYLAWASSLRDIQFFQELLGGGKRSASVEVALACLPWSCHIWRCHLGALLAVCQIGAACCRRKVKSGPTAAELQAEIAAIKVRHHG